VLGVLSMLIWALILVVTVKYVFVTMRADNRGEGGSFALLALIERAAGKSPLLPAIAAAALTATALFYGDAVITPAISILSAVEGLSLLDDAFTVLVIPLTLAIVVALFAVQRYGADDWLRHISDLAVEPYRYSTPLCAAACARPGPVRGLSNQVLGWGLAARQHRCGSRHPLHHLA
jgi:hypothetical protein